MTTCIRRPGATWTTCTCDPCVIRRRRIRKANENGLIPPVPTAEAWDILDGWIARGWTAHAIASATGLKPRATQGLLYNNQAGHRTAMTRPTANRIVQHRNAWPTTGRVGATGTTRRLQALSAMGYGLTEVHDLTGLPMMTLSVLRSGGVDGTSPGNHTTVAAAFDQLAMRPGPSNRARIKATREGWVPPLAWDDIDDPTERPQGLDPGTDYVDHLAVDVAIRGDRPVTLTRPERHLAIRALAAAGLNDRQIADRVGCRQETVMRDRHDLGITSPVKDSTPLTAPRSTAA